MLRHVRPHVAALVACAATLTVSGCAARGAGGEPDQDPTSRTPSASSTGTPAVAADEPSSALDVVLGESLEARPAPLRPVFDEGKVLIAYYGTAQTASMGQVEAAEVDRSPGGWPI